MRRSRRGRCRAGLLVAMLATALGYAIGQMDIGIAQTGPASGPMLPPPPTKAALYNMVAGQLGLERILATVIESDPFLVAELQKAGVVDITKVPSSHPLPYNILTWHGQDRFVLRLVDAEADVDWHKRMEDLLSISEARVAVSLDALKGEAVQTREVLNGFKTSLDEHFKPKVQPAAAPRAAKPFKWGGVRQTKTGVQ